MPPQTSVKATAMAPVTNKATNLDVSLKNGSNDDETDEGFVSPSVQRIDIEKRKDISNQASNRPSESESSNSASDNGSQTSSSPSSSSTGSQGVGLNADEDQTDCRPRPNIQKLGEAEESSNSKTNRPSNPLRDAAESKAESLAKFIVHTLLGKESGNTEDKVEKTLLKCVRMMMLKHEIIFKGMMKRLQVTKETGYVSFVTVANTLFEDEKMVITWSRIVALYAFGGQLALYCKEKDMEDLAYTVAVFLGNYAKEILAPYVASIGGWAKICEEFPEESDIENKIRRLLSWTAVGLGVAATVSYLTSR